MHRLAASIGLSCILFSCKPAEPARESATSTPAAAGPAAASPATATLSIGASAPGFELPNHDGTTVGLAGLTADGPAVLVFYRGDW